MSAAALFTKVSQLKTYCDEKLLQNSSTVFYYSIKKEGIGTGKIKTSARTVFTDIVISPIAEKAMRPGVLYTITNDKDSDRVHFVATESTDKAVTAIAERLEDTRDTEARRDALTFLSEQLMRIAQLNDQVMRGMEKMTNLGDDAHDKRIQQAKTIADIQEKQAVLQEKLDKANTTETAMQGLMVLGHKIADRFIVGKESMDKEIADGLGLNRLLVAQGTSPAQVRAALELLNSKGVKFSDLINSTLMPDSEGDDDEEATDQ